MKNLVLSLIFLFTFSVSAMAQDESTIGPNVLKINPLGFAIGSFNLNYERAISNSSSVQIGGYFFTSLFGTDVSGFGFRGSYRYYITNSTHPAPKGFYTGLTGAYSSFTEDATDVSASTTGVGLLLGYQWIWDSHVVLDLGIGPTYYFASGSETEEDYSGIAPNIVIALGYNF